MCLVYDIDSTEECRAAITAGTVFFHKLYKIKRVSSRWQRSKIESLYHKWTASYAELPCDFSEIPCQAKTEYEQARLAVPWKLVSYYMFQPVKVDQNGWVHSDRSGMILSLFRNPAKLTTKEISRGIVEHGIHVYRTTSVPQFTNDGPFIAIPVTASVHDFVAAAGKYEAVFSKIRLNLVELKKQIIRVVSLMEQRGN